MKTTITRALLALLMLVAAMPLALAEATEPEAAELVDSSAAPAWTEEPVVYDMGAVEPEGEPVYSQDVVDPGYGADAIQFAEESAYYDGEIEPEVGLAQDAGDTGLTIEYEGSEIAEASGEGGEPAAFMEENGLTLEAPDEVAAPEEGALELAAMPQISVGYAAVAPQTIVYADAELSLSVGAFPEGAVVYVEALEREGTLLRIRFDTADARSWAQEFLAGYVLAEEAISYSQEETAALAETLVGDASTRYLEGVAIPCVRYEAQEYAVMSSETVVGLGVDVHTQAEIQAFVNEHPAYRNQLNIYSVAFTDEPYTIGRLSAVNQQSALNMVNQIRYITGLNANLGMLYEQEDAMAAASLVLRLNGGLSHTPPRPAALADASYDALYQQGYSGASHANVAMGYTATGSILAYMADSDDGNIATVGHRRWIIYPRMSQTIFGANGRFSAMYAHDVAGSGEQTKVAWPAQEMPLQYFSTTDPWSVSFGRMLDATQVQVDLVRASDSKAWHFSQGQSDGYFNVENSYYGQTGCVIFRPNALDAIAEGEMFTVSITDGASKEITRYTVRFFNLDLSAANPMDALEVTAIKTDAGNAISWNAVAGATGYYVCRRTETSNYQIVADVTDAASYLDVNVFGDLTYYYQVYAHNASVSSRSAVSVQAKPIAPDSVALGDGSVMALYSNAALQLSPVYTPANASAVLTWDSSKTSVATVDANGLVTPVKKGTTIISVRTDNGKSASVKVKVVSPPKPKQVLLSASGTIALTAGETVQLAAAVQPADAPSAVTWSTSKAKVATVIDGLITAVGEGTATITAKAVNGKKARVKVKVVDPNKPADVTLSLSGTVGLSLGETLQLGAALTPATAQTTLAWSSSKSSVATVDANGLVTPHKEGKATITVKTANGKKAKVKVQVVDPYKPAGVALSQSGTVTLNVGQTLKLDAALTPATAQTTLAWSSSRTGVASVDGNGNVTALKKGSTVITVRTANGKKAKVKIKVVN